MVLFSLVNAILILFTFIFVHAEEIYTLYINYAEKLKENIFLEDFRSLRSNLHDREVLCTGETPTNRPLRDGVFN